MKLRFIEDPGHGWLEVPINLLRELGIEDAISECSYYSAWTKCVYLEEDCDAGIFDMEATKAGWEYEIDREYQEQTFVRGLPNYPYTNRKKFKKKWDESYVFYRQLKEMNDNPQSPTA